MKVVILLSFRLKDEYFLIYENVAFQAIHILKQVKSYCLKIDIWGSFVEFSLYFQSENLSINRGERTRYPKMANYGYFRLLRYYYRHFDKYSNLIFRELKKLCWFSNYLIRFQRQKLPQWLCFWCKKWKSKKFDKNIFYLFLRAILRSLKY